MAWLGPAIGPDAFEVGEDVYSRFVNMDAGFESAFKSVRQAQGCLGGRKWRADIYALARRKLEQNSVNVFGGGFCTYSDSKRFFSYRRDGQTGRMASLIWLS